MGAGSGTTSHAGEEAGKGGDHPRVPGKVTVYSVSHRDQFRNVLHTLQPALRAAKEPVQLAVRGAPQRARQLAAGYSERTAQRTRGQRSGAGPAARGTKTSGSGTKERKMCFVRTGSRGLAGTRRRNDCADHEQLASWALRERPKLAPPVCHVVAFLRGIGD